MRDSYGGGLIYATPAVVRMTWRSLIIGVCLVAVGCYPEFSKDDRTEVGTILQRSLLERWGDESNALLETDDRTVIFHSDDLKALVNIENRRLLIDEGCDREILSIFPERVYTVTARLCIEQTTKKYQVDRETFNALRVGVITKFTVDMSRTAIDSLIAY